MKGWIALTICALLALAAIVIFLVVIWLVLQSQPWQTWLKIACFAAFMWVCQWAGKYLEEHGPPWRKS